MGYSTSFTGELKFTKELTGGQLAELKAFFGEDPNDHKEWLIPETDDYTGYIDFELNDDFSGIKWNGAEKTYGLEHSVSIILMNMQARYNDFDLTGQLLAQGESREDKWVLKIKDNHGIREEIKVEGDIYECPNCGEHVITSEAKKVQ